MPLRRPAAVPALAALLGATFTAGLLTVATRMPGDGTSGRLAAGAPATAPSSQDRAARSVDDLGTLLAAPGKGYHRVTGGTGQGALDAQAIATLSGAGQAFSTLGVRRGYAASWRTASGDRTVATYVFEFADEDGAARYAGGIGGATKMLSKPVAFKVAGVPAAGLADTQRDRDGRYTQLVAIRRGNLAALVVLFAPQPAPQADFVSVVQRQYAKL